MDPQALMQLLLAHKWFAVLALTIGFVVRMGKPDVVGPSLPQKFRAPFAIAMGLAGGFLVPVLQKIAGGAAPKDALVWGLGAAFAAIAGHETFIESLRGGKEIPMPFMMKKNSGGGAGPLVAAIFGVCMMLVPIGIASETTSCAAGTMQQIPQVIDAVPGDVMDGITCIADVVTATQAPDPLAVVSACAKFGIDLTSVYKVVSSLISQKSPAADAAASEVSPQLAKLIRIQQNTKALLARGK